MTWIDMLTVFSYGGIVVVWYQMAYFVSSSGPSRSFPLRAARVVLRPIRHLLVWNPTKARTSARREAILLESKRHPQRALELLSASSPEKILSACAACRDLQLHPDVAAGLFAHIAGSDLPRALRFLEYYVRDERVLLGLVPLLERLETAQSDSSPGVMFSVAQSKALSPEVLMAFSTSNARSITIYTYPAYNRDPLEEAFPEENRDSLLSVLRSLAALMPDVPLGDALQDLSACVPLERDGWASLVDGVLRGVVYEAPHPDDLHKVLHEHTWVLQEYAEWITPAAALRRAGASGSLLELLQAAEVLGASAPRRASAQDGAA
jgi:hypothetical protein